MIQELISTSAPRCLNGNAGFGIVAQTEGMAPNVSHTVAALSGYPHVAASGSVDNPIIYLHAVRRTGGMLRHIVSRIADCGNDYSGRTNRIAHHWIVEEEDVHKLPGGPGALIAQSIFRYNWNDKPAEIPPKKLFIPDVPSKKCVAWEQLTGDAGWGGHVAECAEKGNPISIIFISEHQGNPLRDLIGESLALLPQHVRWNITFSTYFLKSQETNQESIQIKCFLADSEESRFARQSPNTLVIDLRQRADRVPQGKYVDLARGAVKLATMVPLESHESIPAAVPIAVPVPETYSVDDVELEISQGRTRYIDYGRNKNISRSKRSPPDWRQIALLLLLLAVCAMVIGYAVIRITANRTETAKNAEDSAEKQSVVEIQPTDKTTQSKTEETKNEEKVLEPTPTPTNETPTAEPNESEVVKKEESAETQADNTSAAQIQSSEANDNQDQHSQASPQPISVAKLDELKNELPPLWKGLALSVKPNTEEPLLLKSKILYEYRDIVTLKHVPFVNFQNPVNGQRNPIVDEDRTNKHTIIFKYADVISYDINGGKKTTTGEDIAEITLTEEGLQFQWKVASNIGWNSQLIINRILLSQLQILIDNKPFAEIALWEPYDIAQNKKNPGVLFDKGSKLSHEFTPQFSPIDNNETQQDILFAKPNNSKLQRINERYYLLRPDDPSEKLLLMEKSAVPNYNKK